MIKKTTTKYHNFILIECLKKQQNKKQYSKKLNHLYKALLMEITVVFWLTAKLVVEKLIPWLIIFRCIKMKIIYFEKNIKNRKDLILQKQIKSLMIIQEFYQEQLILFLKKNKD